VFKVSARSQPLTDAFLVFVVDKAEHQQHESEGEEAENPVNRIELLHIKYHYSDQSMTAPRTNPETLIFQFTGGNGWQRMIPSWMIF